MAVGEQARDLFRRQSERLTTGGPDVGREARELRGWKNAASLGAKPSIVRRQVADAWVSADDSVQVATLELIDAVAPVVSAAFQRHFVPFAERVVAAWPVKSGTSRSQLQVRIRAAGGIAQADLTSPVKYTFMMEWGKFKTPPGFRTGSNVWQTLVRAPHADLVREMSAAIERGNP